jgi:hypothetical protein
MKPPLHSSVAAWVACTALAVAACQATSQRGSHDAGQDRTPGSPRTDARVGDTRGAAGGAPGRPDASARRPDAANTIDGGGLALLGAPLVVAPTAESFGVNVVLRSGDPSTLDLQVRPAGTSDWLPVDPPLVPAPDVAQWTVTGLQPGLRHAYRVLGGGDVLYEGSAVTARPPGTPFTFSLITDTHIEARDPVPDGMTVVDDGYGTMEQTMLEVMPEVAASAPDLVLNLGDMLDTHQFGFNAPPPDSRWARLGYLNYRRLLGDVGAQAAHFPVIGNWDGESGCNTPDEIARSTSQRMLYAPGPSPTNYLEGGSANEDYYAFTWGDALFIILNVMTYTPTCHLLDTYPGLPDDWTLGATQLAWLERTLAGASAKWRFLFIHHTVGGAAGNPTDSAYGRGGGQAAHVGEQATVHALMLQYGAQIFFYAHDHVFTDMVVDGIHYTLPGSAGAPWKFDESETGYTQYWADSGFARVAVSTESVQVDFMSVTGQRLDGFSLPDTTHPDAGF